MLLRKPSMVLSFLLGLAFLPASVHAVSITVDIGGTTVTGTDSVVISNADGSAKTYGNIKIEGLTAGTTAKVVAGTGAAGGNDANDDKLSLINAKITPVNTFSTEYRIAFWGTFDNKPTTTDGAYAYQLSGSGELKPPFGKNDTVRARGSIEYPSGSWTQIPGMDLSKTVTFTSSTFFSNSLSQNVPSPNIDGQRTLKGEFWFTLKQTQDVLKLSSTIGITLASAPAGGPGGTDIFFAPLGGTCPEGKECLIPGQQVTPCPEGKQCLSCVPRAKTNLLCRWFGWWCPPCVIYEVLPDLPKPDPKPVAN